MPFCSQPLQDPTTLEARVRLFLDDRSSDTVLGPRRMGRMELVAFVSEAAKAEGIRTWTAGDEVTDPGLIVLDHWSLLEGASNLISENPDADVVFGQDLCHQVPAVVRYRREE